MARTNRHVQVDSLVARLGGALEVIWNFGILLVASICGVCLVLFVLNPFAT